MKTPMQEMFDQLKASRKDEYGLAFAIDMLLENEQAMLKKEKEVIKAAYNKGYRDSEIEIGVSLRVGDISKYSNAETYYNETFNTKEK